MPRTNMPLLSPNRATWSGGSSEVGEIKHFVQEQAERRNVPGPGVIFTIPNEGPIDSLTYPSRTLRPLRFLFILFFLDARGGSIEPSVSP
jgi:hypothetical protein